jgi:hypothetical protein
MIQYYLRDRPVTLEILSRDEQATLRSFSPEATGGLNRYVWNMRLPEPWPIAEKGLDAWQRDDGALVLSGTYRVRMTVDGHTQSQPLLIVPDPRISASPDDLQNQFDMLEVIGAKIGTVNELINRIATLQEQLAAWRKWTADHPRRSVFEEAGQLLQSDLDSVKNILIDVHYPEAQLHAVGLQEMLNALFEFVDSADYAPPQQAREALADLSGRLEVVRSRLDHEVLPKVTAVNEAIQAVGITPLAVP